MKILSIIACPVSDDRKGLITGIATFPPHPQGEGKGEGIYSPSLQPPSPLREKDRERGFYHTANKCKSARRVSEANNPCTDN